MCMIKHFQGTQSNKFVMSLQYLKNVGIIIFDGSGQSCPKYPKEEVGNIFGTSLEKECW